MSNVQSMWHARPSRGVAFSIHLALSFLIFSSLVAMMLLYWFPGDLFFIDGGWEGLKLVAMVDLVLGPALTLILYKPDKPKLVFDMSTIATIQIVALAYGFYTTHDQRTVAVVFAEQKFMTVSAKDHEEASQKLLSFDIQPKPLEAAKLLRVPLYLTPDPPPGEFGEYLANIMNGYPGARERSDQYVSIAARPDELKKSELTRDDLEQQGVLTAVEDALDKKSMHSEDVEFYEFEARYAKGVVVFDPEAQRIVDYVPHQETKQSVATAED